MKIKAKIYLILSVLIVVILAFLIGKCSTRSERVQQLNNLVASRDSVRRYSVEIDGLKISVQEKSAIILTQKQAIDAGLLEQNRLKTLHIRDVVTNTTLEGTIRILRDSLAAQPETIFITIRDTSGVTRDYVRLPFQLLREHNEYLSLDAGMYRNHEAWFDLSIPVAGEMTVGWKKEGIFKRPEPVGVFMSKDSHENPYLKFDKMEVVITQSPVRIVDRWWIHVLGGVVLDEGTRWIFGR